MAKNRQKFLMGFQDQFPTGGVIPVTVEAPQGTEVEIKKLVAIQSSYEVQLIDGRIGEDLLPLNGPIDFSFFFGENSDFEVGTITPDRPLTLYLQTLSSSSVLPYYNFVVSGWATDWVAPKITPERQKRVGEIVFSHYERWLQDDQQIETRHLHLFTDPLNAYLNNEDLPEIAKTPGFSVLKRYLDARGLRDSDPKLTPAPNTMFNVQKISRPKPP